MKSVKTIYDERVINLYEQEIAKIKIELSEYFSKEIKENFDINNYIEIEKNEAGNYNNHWVDLRKLKGTLYGNYLILIFDYQSTPLAYKYVVTEENNKVTEEITYIDIIHMKAIKYAFGEKKVKKVVNYKTYLMLDKNTNYIKIGKSSNPKFREKTLQSENPRIEMIHIINKDVEKELHDEYACNRGRGEWFNLTQGQIKDIKLKYSI